MTMNREKNCDLQKIPGVGKNIEEDLLNIGIRTIEDLKGKDPEELYQRDCIHKGFQEDGRIGESNSEQRGIFRGRRGENGWNDQFFL